MKSKTEQKQSKAEQGRAKQPKADQSRARQSKAEQHRARQSKAEQSRARQSRAEQGRSKQSRATQISTQRGVRAHRMILELTDVIVSWARTEMQENSLKISENALKNQEISENAAVQQQ